MKNRLIWFYSAQIGTPARTSEREARRISKNGRGSLPVAPSNIVCVVCRFCLRVVAL